MSGAVVCWSNRFTIMAPWSVEAMMNAWGRRGFSIMVLRAAPDAHLIPNQRPPMLRARETAVNGSKLSRPPHFVRQRAIGQRFGEMDPADLVEAVEIGERARHPQHTMIAAGGKPHSVGRLAQKSEPARIRPRDVFQHRAGHRGVAAD